MMSDILLRSDKDRNPYPARISTGERGKWGIVTFQAGPHFFQIAAEQVELSILFRNLANSFQVKTVADVVSSITPEQVIAYFEASEVLQVHAADVRAVLEPMTGRGRGVSQLQADVEALRPYQAELLTHDGRLARGYTRRAACILFGSEDANGGTNLTRIRAAMVQLVNEITTTTKIARSNGPEIEQKAA